MDQAKFVFLAGLHRSGTSLLHEILRNHPRISGFHDTGVPQDEGQHLQSVYEPAATYGGPGNFAFDKNAYMNEYHPLATAENAKKLISEWGKYYDMSADYLIEKSPPNLIRMRFLQALFPGSVFIVILRHPVAVSIATQKWSKTTTRKLLEHTLLAYEAFRIDIPFLEKVFVLRYEKFVQNPQAIIDEICRFIGTNEIEVEHEVRKDINARYFEAWTNSRKYFTGRMVNRIPPGYESRINVFGYSMEELDVVLPLSWCI